MFFFHYITCELRRRHGRTILTALGLAVGVGLVIMVNALSTGLDNAQSSVLKPLTGVGTEMSVSRPLQISSSGGFAKLSKAEQKELRNEVGGGPGINFASLKAGSKVDTDTFRASGALTFPESELTALSKIKGVQALAPSLTLTDTHLQGTIPKINISQKSERFTTTTPGSTRSKRGGAPGAGGGSSTRTFNAFGRASATFGGGSLTTSSRSITGVDQSQPALGVLTSSQITKGSYFTSSSGAYQAIISTGYADSEKLAVGATLKIDNKTFKVVGISSAPLGGTASDIYVELTTLQKLAGYKGQVDTVEVEAVNAADVNTVSKAISKNFSGASVTTAADLASRITGSLTDAKNLSSKLGTALEIIALIAAVLIASLLTLASIAKRTREIGTLKAIGWSRFQVVRQISGETLGQGVIGGILGVGIGAAGVGVINALGWTLKATVAAPATATTAGGGGGFLGQAASSITSGTTAVKITAVASIELIIIAVVLAIAGGFISGIIGGFRAARLRPAVALRTVE